jgi:phosphopantothenoylcysteine decarboxylase/phosphopantothenate--cysteine ligase
MQNPLNDKHILLGVTGSIACYKAADLASKLTQAGALVDVILTDAATRFITPLTFQSVTGRKAFADDDLWGSQGHVLHVQLGKDAELMIIAPATANTLAKLAHGLADNLLTVTALAANCPILIAPAMDGGMYQHPATQANLDILRQRGFYVAGPVSGHLASGQTGTGRMVEPVELVGYARMLLGREGSLAGSKVIVTAGGTREPIDPVRSITNRSSGKQGFALAQAAVDQGAEVILISGPVTLSTPIGAKRKNVNTTREMLDAVLAELNDSNILIMAAAAADFTLLKPAKDKIKKSEGIPTIQLTTAPDILEKVAAVKAQTGMPEITVGFAAESRDLIANAQTKLKAKKLDMIVANDISANDAGFEVDTNRVTLLYPDGASEYLPLMSKDDVAGEIIAQIASLLASKR